MKKYVLLIGAVLVSTVSAQNIWVNDWSYSGSTATGTVTGGNIELTTSPVSVASNLQVTDPPGTAFTSYLFTSTDTFDPLGNDLSGATYTISAPVGCTFVNDLDFAFVRNINGGHSYTFSTPSITAIEMLGSASVSGSTLTATNPGDQAIVVLTGSAGLSSVTFTTTNAIEEEYIGIGAEVQTVPEPSASLLAFFWLGFLTLRRKVKIS